MKTFRDFFNEQLITEAYKFENSQDVIDAIESNKVGVKILPEYKNYKKYDYISEKIRRFFTKSTSLNNKDITYGIQLMLSKVPIENLENIINCDGFYELLKSRNREWVKELPEYKTLMNDKIWLGSSINDFFVFEKAVQSEKSNHGKINKGAGDLKDVNVLYDDGIWKLMTVTTFEGAKAASFYNKDGKEVPTSWCTRADKYYFNNYTKNGKYPLYIFRNLKNGNAYQMAFEEDWGIVYVNFLDHNDIKGDEITQGDFSKIPDDLLKLVKSPFGKFKGKSLAEYKNAVATDPNEGKKGYIDKRKQKFKDAVDVDNEKIKNVLSVLGKSEEDYKALINKYGKVKKQISVGGTYAEITGDKLTKYYNTGKKEENNYQKKAGIRRYYYEKRPDVWIEIISKKNSTTVVNDKSSGKDRTEFALNILQYVSFLDIGEEVYVKSKNKIMKKSDIEDIEREEKYKKKMEKVEELSKQELKQHAEKLKIKSFELVKPYNMKLPSYARYKRHNLFTVFDDNYMPGSNLSIVDKEGEKYRVMTINKKAYKKENVLIYNDKNGEISNNKQILDFAWKVINTYNKNWIKVFRNEIIDNRAEGNFLKIYENYFNY